MWNEENFLKSWKVSEDSKQIPTQLCDWKTMYNSFPPVEVGGFAQDP